ncbi:MAG: hypothetical protein WC707_05225 [Candidatus Babeliaceae bacterium]|jgi:A/G-specific adenine glycosylase
MKFDNYIQQNGLLSPEGVEAFRQHIYAYYAEYGRVFSWRQTTNPYHIVVSEIMLQQTQTDRVKDKFIQFITHFPTFEALAQASTRDVITLWQGLGYSRRALALLKIAQAVTKDYNSTLPANPEILLDMPGIGPATAGSICAFAFNMPTVFIETNIRSVFIHLFFSQRAEINDKELFPLVEQALDKLNPRVWYYALTDYGVMIKKQFKNPNIKSSHYAKQSKFEGSERQIRGMILRILTSHQVPIDFEFLCASIDRPIERIEKNLGDLCCEGFVSKIGNYYCIL